MDYSYTLLILCALSIICGLSFYAGRLLFKLSEQQKKATSVRNARIHSIIDSIQLIAKAMEQQQCNLSEGSIRIVKLLEALPVSNPPDYGEHYPVLFKLFEHVADLPTHEARKALSRKERDAQDEAREELEAQLEADILKEVSKLKVFSV